MYLLFFFLLSKLFTPQKWTTPSQKYTPKVIQMGPIFTRFQPYFLLAYGPIFTRFQPYFFARVSDLSTVGLVFGIMSVHILNSTWLSEKLLGLDHIRLSYTCESMDKSVSSISLISQLCREVIWLPPGHRGLEEHVQRLEIDLTNICPRNL